MIRRFGRRVRVPLALLTAVALAVGACSGGSSVTAPPSAAGPASSVGGNGGNGNGGGSVVGGAAAKLSAITSYKFSMTLAGGDYSSLLSALGGTVASGNAPFTMSGTIVLQPAHAADITMGSIHLIEIGGSDYLDVSGSGAFIATPMSTSIVDSFAPATMFSSMVDPSAAGGFAKVGTGQKNGVSADHYQGSQAVLAGIAAGSGLTGATWTADIWIATSGGYPVSMAIAGTAADKSIAYEILFDITNANDPANKVVAPKV
jgi:hypothetical protein